MLLGFAVFLSVGVLCHSIVGMRIGGTGLFKVADILQMSVFSLILMWWAWVAWKPASVPTAVVARLQPWAQSW